MATRVSEREVPQGAVARTRAYLHTFADLSPNARRLLIATMCIWIGIGISGVLFNLYLISVGHTVAFVGVVSAVTTVGQAGLSPLISPLMRRYSAQAIMAIGTAGMVVTTALSAIFTNALILVVVSVIGGAAVSAATIPSSPYMMEHSSAQQRSHLFSAYMAAGTIGSMIGSLLSGALPALVGVVLSLRGQVAHDRVGLLAGAAIIGIGIWFFARMSDERPSPDSADRPGWPSPEVAHDEAETRNDVLMMLAATTFIAVALGGIYPFFNVFFASRLHASAATIGAIYALSGVACTVAAFFAPAAARRGTLTAFSVTRALTAPMFFVFWLHPGLAIATAAYIGRNILGTITGALENTFSMEAVPSRLRGTVAGWRTFAFNGGWTLGSLVAGLVVARFGFDVIFVASGLLTIVGVVTWRLRFGQRYS